MNCTRDVPKAVGRLGTWSRFSTWARIAGQAESLVGVRADARSVQALLAEAAGHREETIICVSFSWGADTPARNSLLPPPYGHLFGHLHAFWEEIVRVQFSLIDRDNNRSRRPWVSLAIPGGKHVGGERAFEEIELLWSSNATRMRIQRLPWVPICMHGCCWSAGSPPKNVRLALITRFPSEPDTHARWVDFRHDAWRALGISASEAVAPRRPRILYVAAESGSNGRHIADEMALIQAMQALVISDHPSWSFEILRLGPHLRYDDEIRTVAGAKILVSLFGSALWNCLYMANGSLVVEIHAALRNDFRDSWHYRNTCERSAPLGVSWVGHAPVGFRTGEPNATSDAYSIAHVDVDRFVHFFSRVLHGELQPLLREYEAAVTSRRGIGRV